MANKSRKGKYNSKYRRAEANKVILVIPDQHFPFAHRDIIKFLSAVKAKYKPTRVVNLGDEAEYAQISFHPSDPDMPGAGDELKKTKDMLRPLMRLFPVMDILESNHGSMHLRKAFMAGLPMALIKSYREILDAPDGWTWHPDLILDLPTGEKVFFHPGMSANGIQLSQSLHMNTVQGHHHTIFKIEYSAGLTNTVWAMQPGCLIDDASRAFSYNKLQKKRPILGCGLIINGSPRLVQMRLNPRGSWDGVVD